MYFSVPVFPAKQSSQQSDEQSDDEEEKQPPVRKIFVLLILINCHEIAQEAIACEEGR